MDFITQNIGTIAVLIVLSLIIAMIVRKMRKDKKEGKTACGCGCEGCAMKGSCHPTNSK